MNIVIQAPVRFLKENERQVESLDQDSEKVEFLIDPTHLVREIGVQRVKRIYEC